MLAVYCSRAVLAATREGHERRKASTVPWWEESVPSKLEEN